MSARRSTVCSITVVECGDHTGASDAGGDLVTEIAQPLGNDRRGPNLSERQFGMPMQILVELAQGRESDAMSSNM